MPAEKRNHFLDIDESDDDGSQGYDSEAEQPPKGTSKSRKLNQDDGSDEEPLSDDEIFGEGGDGDEEEEELEEDGLRQETASRDGATSEKAVKRSGVIYISKIPPFIYLAPKDAQIWARRLQQGQDRKNFNKAAVNTLNSTTLAAVGIVKKGSYYHDDIWSLQYLKGFKWSDTAEQQSRTCAEISKATKENKRLEGIQSKAEVKKFRDTENTIKATADIKVTVSTNSTEKGASQPIEEAKKALS
ncbi:Pre-rRNA-processing protein ESF2 [Nemania diffusa]|nr:Pre-rRNA-processing protein ESF2 [Nemania diffusa]